MIRTLWTQLWTLLSRKQWSPYAAGTGLGIVTTIAMTVCHKRLSGAGAYQNLSGYVGRLIAPDGLYWTRIVPTGLTWEVYLAVGTFSGALASAFASRQFKIRTMPDSQWTDVFGRSVVWRWLIVAVGTTILEYAASVAGGCTASLAVSSGAALAPGAFLFVAGMFAGGVPVALGLYRRHR